LLYNTKNKYLCHKLHSNAGRNNTGTITVRHRGSGKKTIYLNVDYSRRLLNTLGVCIRVVYNGKKTALIGLIKYSNGAFSYILLPQGMKIWYFVRSCQYHKLYYGGYKVGYAVFLRYIGINSIIFNIEPEPNAGGKYIRAAGTYGIIMRKTPKKDFIFIKLPTSKLIVLTEFCLVTLGKSSNKFHYKSVTGKAGLNRKKGIRPTVRGVAMNPVDHPHGGRTKTNSPEVTPWGKIAKFNR